MHARPLMLGAVLLAGSAGVMTARVSSWTSSRDAESARKVAHAAGAASFGVNAPSQAGRRECPHDWNPKDSVVPSITHVPGLPGDIVNVPEFHDCQRAIIDSGSLGLRYGPHIAIFAAQQLAQLVQRLDSTFDSTARRDRFAYAAAEIWSNGRYAPLGIEDKQNCLFLWRAGGVWRAEMVAATARGLPATFCQQELPTGTSMGGTKLSVFPRTFASEGFEDEDYPPVARWDWDDKNRVQYIGIKCGAAWCEVGQPNLVSSPSLPVTGSMSRREKRVRLVKGWHDYQLLATLPTAGTPEPTTIRGYFIPVADLGQQNAFGDFANFRDVSQVILHAPSTPANLAALAKYRAHFGFVDGVTAGVDARIAMCYGTRASCGVPAGGASACGTTGPGDDPPWVPLGSPSASARRWYTRVSSGGATRYSCATRYRGHLDMSTGRPFDIPGTVRWRWKVDDEGGWMRCVFGCCELL